MRNLKFDEFYRLLNAGSSPALQKISFESAPKKVIRQTSKKFLDAISTPISRGKNLNNNEREITNDIFQMFDGVIYLFSVLPTSLLRAL